MKIEGWNGLSISMLNSGLLSSIDVGPMRVSLRAATSFSKFGANIYLRLRGPIPESIPLSGPLSPSEYKVKPDGLFVQGRWKNVEYNLSLRPLGQNHAWVWTVDIRCLSGAAQEYDLICVQDVGLKERSQNLANEYFISQYIERTILEDQHYGKVVCCRQNNPEPVGNPWLMVFCSKGAVAGATDGMLIYGPSFRESGVPSGLLHETLGGEYAGESSIVALQGKPFGLSPGKTYQSHFVFAYQHNHPLAISPNDLQHIPMLLAELPKKKKTPMSGKWEKPQLNLFNSSPLLKVENLDEWELNELFGPERNHAETDGQELLSFFRPNGDHVVLKSKELRVDRPHGHIIQAHGRLDPDEGVMSTNPFASGVFNAHVTQGNTNFNIFLSIFSSQFGLTHEAGQRMFVKVNNQYHLLGIPSAFEMGLNHCQWIYRFGSHCIQLQTWTAPKLPMIQFSFRVLSGEGLELVLTHQFDPLNAWTIKPEVKKNRFLAKPNAESMLSEFFPEAQFRIAFQSESRITQCNDNEEPDQFEGKGLESLFVLHFQPTKTLRMQLVGEVTSPHPTQALSRSEISFQNHWEEAHRDGIGSLLSIEGNDTNLGIIRDMLPWFYHNALVHYLTPYGLEQFSGAAWGTRDVSQGPIELLLHLGKYREARRLLLILFSNQHPDGSWPQWWMFDRYSHVRAPDSHGDVVYWCILALCNYIRATSDFTILGESVPYFSPETKNFRQISSIQEHLERLVEAITDSFIHGTALVPFGGGDWNDSLQPVNPDLAQRLISSWTVAMNYQAFIQYHQICNRMGNHNQAAKMLAICERIRADFNRHLVRNGVVAGYGLFQDDGTIDALLHPSDKLTGISYSLLPMERGVISGIFSKEQAVHHMGLIEQHLKGPDGARLMDKPLVYRGGNQSIFKRAESSSFFGREIGLMYTHEHLRYAELLAITGQPERFIKALRKVVPIAYQQIVPPAVIRQSNCFYSSSDVVFRSRYEANKRYMDVIAGNMPLRGGWRIYSSGPGIFIGIIISRLFGIRAEFDTVVIDPVMPKSMDNTSFRIELFGKNVVFKFRIQGEGFGPQRVSINGRPIEFEVEDNPFRHGGAVVPKIQFLSMPNEGSNTVEVLL